MIWKLIKKGEFRAPICQNCGSMRTFTQSTREVNPYTQHNCKCRNCGCNWKEFSIVVATGVV